MYALNIALYGLQAVSKCPFDIPSNIVRFIDTNKLIKQLKL